jgi:hypothetical protein
MVDASYIMVTTLAPAGQLAASCTTQWDTIRRTKRHVFKRLPCPPPPTVDTDPICWRMPRVSSLPTMFRILRRPFRLPHGKTAP